MATSGATTAKTIGFWTLKIVFAPALLAAGGARLAGLPVMVHEFDIVGFGQWFRYYTAVLEISGAIMLLAPKTSAYGAIVLAAVCVGAFFAQRLKLHGDIIHAIVMALILAWIAWAQRDQLAGRGRENHVAVAR
jgi:putative oxidoreductase